MIKRNPKNLVAAALLILAILFAAGLLFRKIHQSRQNDRKSPAVPQVHIMTAKPSTEDILLTLPGYLVAYNVTPILARTNGYLKNFLVDIGDTVEENQILCEIETPDIDAEWEQAKAILASIEAKNKIAHITAHRVNDLYNYDQESISKQDVDEKNAAYEAAIADVTAAQANINRLEVLKNFKYVRAPFKGIVAERNIDVGSLISIGNENMTQPYQSGYETVSRPLFKISNLNPLRVFVDVPQPFYPHIKDGAEAQISVPEYPNKVFKGVIDKNAIVLNQSTRTLLTQVNIENPEYLLRPGIYALVQFAFKPYRDSFTIPIQALIIRNGPPFVAILNENNIVEMREVRIGRDNGKSVEIIHGINEGDRLVTNPNFRIKEGLKVEPVMNSSN